MNSIIIQPEVIKTLADCVVDIIQNKIDWSSIDWQAVAEKAAEERPTGEWITEHRTVECCLCGCWFCLEEINGGKANFCPNCGARMEAEK